MRTMELIRIAITSRSTNWLSLLVALSSCLMWCGCSQTDSEPASLSRTIFLVRHAEKELNVDNPRLTAAGQARAESLKELLSTEDIQSIYSSDFRRTIETANPLAESCGLEVKIYDPSKLAEFAKELQSSTGNCLVVGHSNTTPELTKLLTGEEVVPMPETEYDRLIRVVVGKDGEFQRWSTDRF